ncbi:uncharacterized protein LOC135473970 [Liolophura sinensis]|uniref:uncharacterized protein LOC135473970 n=1 Tax=Liolophura sinensis TaxID=3198878 RepID=UPI00315939E7
MGPNIALFIGVILLFLGMSASSECSSSPVQLIATSRKQVLTSPGYPNQYDRALLCRWIIHAEGEGEVVRLKVKDTQLEPSTGCRSDYVQIHDGPHRIYKPLYRWCGTRRPPVLLPTSHNVLAVFKTNLRDCRRGFALEYWCERKDGVKQTKMTPGVHRDLLLVLVGLISFTFLAATLFLMANRIKIVLVSCRDNIYRPAVDRTSSQPGATNTEDRSSLQLTSPLRPHIDFHAVVKMAENTLIRDMQFGGQTEDNIDGVKQSKETENSKIDRKRVMYVFYPPKEGAKSQGKMGDQVGESMNTHVSVDDNAKIDKSKRQSLTTPTAVTSGDRLGSTQSRMRTSREQSLSTPEVRVSPAPERNIVCDKHVSSVIKTTVFSTKLCRFAND